MLSPEPWRWSHEQAPKGTYRWLDQISGVHPPIALALEELFGNLRTKHRGIMIRAIHPTPAIDIMIAQIKCDQKNIHRLIIDNKDRAQIAGIEIVNHHHKTSEPPTLEQMIGEIRMMVRRQRSLRGTIQI